MPEEQDDDIVIKRLKTLKEAKIKAAHYCAYQERTQQEVLTKLRSLELSQDEADEVLSELILEDFVNEERFSKTYAGSKFRLKSWGRKKIVFELKKKGISEFCLKKGLEEINEDQYRQKIFDLFAKKDRSMTSKNQYDRMAKLTRHLISKGFEPELVRDCLQEFLKSE